MLVTSNNLPAGTNLLYVVDLIGVPGETLGIAAGILARQAVRI